MDAMLPPRPPDPDESQRGASDPRASVWVAASAGTGKTKVLIDRVLRLMLAGTDPRRILCLTYTKAAAAEMANRLTERLGIWATADADRLDRELRDLLGTKPGDGQRRRAPQLFARVLDTPGGLNIQTIHAFCQSLLGRFPLEAGVAPHFVVLEEQQAKDLLTLARHEVLAHAECAPGPLAAALATVTRHLHEGRFAELVAKLAEQPERLAAVIGTHGSVAAAAEAARNALGLAADETPAGIVAAACNDSAFDAAALRRAAAALACGTPPECERAGLMAEWLAADAERRAESFNHYASVFLTKDNGGKLPTLRKNSNLITKDTAAAAPGAREAMQAEGERLLCVLPRLRAARTAEATEALLLVGEALLAEYRRLKVSRAMLDYADLIDGAARLLRGDGAAAWALYKLDGGIDHVLIDEAQDTAPAQWEVIRSLSDEFFAGEGARGTSRTVFAVGDVKQSIYSFQGADPAEFIASRKHFGRKVKAAGLDWRPIDMTVSFRSTRAVLAAVDATFGSDEMARSIALEPVQIVHQAHRLLDGGAVELWPPVAPRPLEPSDPWRLPDRRVGGDSPQRRLAQLVARRIGAMIVGGEKLQALGRPVVAGDIMVLVRRRTPFMHALVRALKECGVPVAGLDRMLLTEQLAVMDLLAVARFALLPEDDLTLATVLKGPLVGFDDDQLFTIAHARSGALWTSLQARAETDARCAAAHAWLSAVLARADQGAPYEFFAQLLNLPAADTAGGGTAASGRQALLARLGREAEDPLTEFLDLAVAHQRTQPPSLQAFLHRLDRAPVEIKRDPEDSSRNAVRVMTVHGAKGLQAPIVFLPDTCQPPVEREPLIWTTDPRRWPLLLWPPRSRYREDVCEDARRTAQAKQAEEYRRLLYVAMTRARDRLFVCGWLNKNATGAADGSWYALITSGLSERQKQGRLELTETCDPFLARQGDLIDHAQVLRLECAQEAPATPAAPAALLPAEPLPEWARTPPPEEPPSPRPLRPSRPDAQPPPVLAPLAEGGRFLRGRLIHKLLQQLPDVPAAVRSEATRRWLARPTHRLAPETQAEIAAEVLAVVADPRFAPLFGPGSRAEVPLSGEIGGRPVTGQIDRLLLTAHAVTILDYKSDRPAPAEAADVSPVYLRQMALYRSLLRRIYPGRAVRCVLLWTETPRAMDLPDALLDPWTP